MRTWTEKHLTQEQTQALLDVIEYNQDAFKDARRAHAMIFLGFNLGLRISEICLLRREHFNLQRGYAEVPTLKQTEKISHQCKKCGKHVRVGYKRVGRGWPCDKCGEITKVQGNPVKSPPPLRPIPFLEKETIEYLAGYMGKLPKEQQDLFVTQCPRGRIRVANRQDLWRDFRLACSIAGLNHHVPHGMRHGRGQRIWKKTGDINMVKDGLRHRSAQSSMIYTHADEVEKSLAKLESDSIRAKPL